MVKKVSYTRINTQLGQLYIASTKQGLCRVEWSCNDGEEFFSWLNKNFEHIHEDISDNESIINQLKQYFNGKLKKFKVKFDLAGTAFQKNVWAALLDIPYGQVCSYKDIAQKIGKPNAFRAVGMANNKNNISVIIPCHRVIGHDGKLVGYGGGIDIKEKLLALEGRTIRDGRVIFK